MKKTKKSFVVFSAIATIALCVSLIAGATFALFTSNDNVNISVTSGKVAIVATVDEDSLTLSSMGVEMNGNEWENGGTASFSDKSVLTLNNITPGDSARFDINVKNNSSVNIKYRVTWAVEGQLADVLEFSTTGALKSVWNDWLLADKDADKTISVELALPESVGNDYQEQTATVTFAVEAVQGNAPVFKTATTTAEAQALLDAATEGDTIMLKAGEYGTLYFNQSQLSGQYDRETTPYKHYWLYRNFDNISIVGEEGTVVDGIALGASLYNNNPNNKTFINPVTGDYTCFYATYLLNNITIKDITFKKGINMDALDMANGQYASEFNGLTIENCKTVDNGMELKNNSQYNKLADVRLVKNLVVKNCEINNRYQGIYLQAAENVTIENCSFDTLYHNAVQITAGSKGNIVIKSNTVNNDGDRALRFDKFTEGSITVVDNTFTNSGDGDGELCKVNTLGENVEVFFAGNDWCGRSFAEAVIGFGKVQEAELICTAEELAAFAEDVRNGNTYIGKTVALGADISLAGIEWEPIGKIDLQLNAQNKLVETGNCSFAGTFDGKGYTISDLTAVGEDSVGLFARIANATVKNVTIHNATVTGALRVGALAGSGYTGVIDNCHITGKVEVKGNYQVGGLIGYGYSKLTNCSVIGDEGSFVTGEYVEDDKEGDAIGGLVGYMAENGDKGTPRDYNLKVCGITVTGTRKVGGIAGQIGTYSRTLQNVTVENVTVKIDGPEEYLSGKSALPVGGMFGEITQGDSKADYTFTVIGKVSNVTVIGKIADTTGNVYGSSARASRVTVDATGVSVTNAH